MTSWVFLQKAYLRLKCQCNTVTSWNILTFSGLMLDSFHEYLFMSYLVPLLAVHINQRCWEWLTFNLLNINIVYIITGSVWVVQALMCHSEGSQSSLHDYSFFFFFLQAELCDQTLQCFISVFPLKKKAVKELRHIPQRAPHWIPHLHLHIFCVTGESNKKSGSASVALLPGVDLSSGINFIMPVF